MSVCCSIEVKKVRLLVLLCMVFGVFGLKFGLVVCLGCGISLIMLFLVLVSFVMLLSELLGLMLR